MLLYQTAIMNLNYVVAHYRGLVRLANCLHETNSARTRAVAFHATSLIAYAQAFLFYPIHT
jgi:hypothetical protein